MSYVKKAFKYITCIFLVLLVSLSLYTFVVTDILKKDYANVFGYTTFLVASGSMSGTIEKNDLIFVKLTDKVQPNDIITYKNNEGEYITHRLIQKIGDKYITKGDINNISDDPVGKENLIGKVTFVISPSFILKLIAIFLIIFIFLSLINFDKVVKKISDRNDKNSSSKSEVPEDIFYKEKNKDEKSTGLTVNIPVEEIENMQKTQEAEALKEESEDIEVLESEDIIDIDSNSIVTKERNNAHDKEKELLEQVCNLLRIKNDSLTMVKINKKWLVRYQYVYKLANILLLDDMISFDEAINHPSFKEIYDYDLEKAGLYENLRNKIYDMPIYVFLRILTFAILYNDDEFFDGIYKIMKYKVQIDKNSYFKSVKKNDIYGRKQLKALISFMNKISLKFDNKNVFELEKIERLVKLKNYANK